MNERHVHWSRYAFALGLTILILFTTIMTFFATDNARMKELNRQSEELQARYDALQVQQLYLSTLPNNKNSCPSITIALQDAIKQLARSLDNVQRVRESTLINTRETEIIERTYLNDNIRYWIFAKKAKEICNANIVTILYFTTTNKCDECEQQGDILSYYKKKLQDNILIFPINTALREKETIISVLESQYEITTTPAIVIEDTTYTEPLTREQLLEILKNKYYDT